MVSMVEPWEEHDWTQHHALGGPDEVVCRCGGLYHSYVKAKLVGNRLLIFSEQPCPVCGEHDMIYKASSPPEIDVIRG